ncbi:MAG: hypothetical protein DMG04_22850, partial [Acidobacteria bacterium]
MCRPRRDDRGASGNGANAAEPHRRRRVGAELARPDRARRPVSGPPADSNTTAAATPAERDRPKRGWTERARAEQAPPLRQSFAAKTVDATPLDRFVRGITLAWLLGVFVLLGRMLGGWWRVRRLQRIALAATPPSRWQLACRRLAERLDVVAAHVVESTLVDVPTVVGWLRPVILLPVAAVAALTPAQVEAILAHELAHIRRHDYAVNVLQTIAETLLFYHPAVWWLSKQIRLEREDCCDDVAVAVCGDGVAYAQALANLETWRTTSPVFAVAASGGSLVDRVRRIVRVPIPEEPRSHGWAATVALSVLFTAGAGSVQHLLSFGVRTIEHAASRIAWRVASAQTVDTPEPTAAKQQRIPRRLRELRAWAIDRAQSVPPV